MPAARHEWARRRCTLTPEQQAPIRARLEETSAPASEEFFDILLGGQPTLILIDEIAQYLSRMEAAFLGIGAEQSAAFLMSLSTYAAGRAQVAVVLSLASASNAFGDFNQLVRKLQDKHGMTQAQAEAIVAEARSERGGIDMTSAVYEMASPAIKPATVHSAFEQLGREANFLRNRNGRLYADTVPTLNNILRRIEGSVREDEERVAQVVRKLIEKSAIFDVQANITDSEAIPDKTARPRLGILAFTTGELDPARFVEQRGAAIREHQNLVFLLAPSTLHLAGTTWSETRVQQERRARHNILTLARPD